jgi:aspartate racemase
MSWESTALYYDNLNREVNKQLGKHNSAKIIMSSVNFEEIKNLQHQGKWEKLEQILLKEALKIQDAKADFLLIATNTMHKVEPYLSKNIKIPILHIADTTAHVLIKDEITKVGFIGTAFSMSEDFYTSRLKDKFGINAIVPNVEDQKIIHDIIYNELCLGVIRNDSKVEYIKIMNKLQNEGAQAIILGCTEISMLIKQEDTNIKLYDTTSIHAKASVQEAIK